MTILIAEKPSVGRELAKAIHAKEYKDGYIAGGHLNGDECCVTWAVGHLVEIHAATPQNWNKNTIPILPTKFDLIPVKDRKKQLETIRKLISSCDMVVNCGDAGREGELIQRYILEWCGYKGPVMRLWISSLTDEAIKRGLKNLRPGSNYDALFHAGRARNEADWLVGINATMALTASVREKYNGFKGVLSLGRVQTPTLAMVCSRYLEHKNFVPEDFWRIRIETSSKGVKFEMKSEQKYKMRTKAESDRKRVSVSLLEILSSETERKNILQPLLHDLTSLQKTANNRLGMTAEMTLRTAQALYEKKLITYPRTGSKYISEDIYNTINERIKTISQTTQLHMHAEKLIINGTSRRCVNDDKVTDHHALLIETTTPMGMNKEETDIYMLIAERMLEAFSTPSIEDVVRVKAKASDVLFTASGTTIVDPGWKIIKKIQETDEKDIHAADDCNQILPQLKIHDKLEILRNELVQGVTRPKQIHTESSLLAAMESAGKELEDKHMQEIMKGSGIGTPATRAGIIETLKKRGYIKESGKNLIPSDTGMSIWKLTQDMMISDVSMTGQWEQQLDDIVNYKKNELEFGLEIREYARKVSEEIFGSSSSMNIATDENIPTARCPCCGKAMTISEKYAKCPTKDCGLFMNRFVFGKKLGAKTVVKLLENGRCGIVRGLKSKTGKEFEAKLTLKVVEVSGRKYANIEPEFNTPDTGKKQRKGSSSKTRR